MTTVGLRAVRCAVLLCAFASLARAQLIPIKTVPIAQGDQFQIFPSNNLGMGSVSIALPDSLQDPFVNPATGVRLRAARFFSAPTVYSVSQGAGGGRSLPLAALARTTTWFGGFAGGWRTPCGPRRPMRWRTVWRLTRLGRPPVV